MIIGLLGEKFSGKDTAAKYLQTQGDWIMIRHSQILDEVLELFDIPPSRENEIALGVGLRQQFGDDVLARAVKKRLTALKGKNVIVNGMRFPHELELVKDFGAKVVYITASPEVRYARYLHRKEKPDDGLQSFDAFMEVERTAPTEVGIPALGKQSDYTIINDSTLEDFYKQLDRII